MSGVESGVWDLLAECLIWRVGWEGGWKVEEGRGEKYKFLNGPWSGDHFVYLSASDIASPC